MLDMATPTAPFSLGQVRTLQKRQLFRELEEPITIYIQLNVYSDGECPEEDCTYTQDWAHAFMFEPDPNML